MRNTKIVWSLVALTVMLLGIGGAGSMPIWARRPPRRH